MREDECRLDKRPATEQLVWGPEDVWHPAYVKRIPLPVKLSSLRQKLYRKAKLDLFMASVCLSEKFKGKPDAGNPHVRFEEGEGSPPSLLYCISVRQDKSGTSC